MSGRTGIVFNVQHFSVHDGPGIRTVVFVKGCPLRCRWCANPESQRFDPEFGWTAKECIGCGACVKTFSEYGCHFEEDSLLWSREHADRIPAAREVDSVCPTGAFHVIGEERTVEALIAEVERDRVFYENSGGGLTISGGEPLAQADFTAALLEEAGRRQLHRTMETCGCAPSAAMERVAPLLDTLYYDIKLLDPVSHETWTGAPNEDILRNLRLARALRPDLPILVRTPVIPGVNDHEEMLCAIAGLVREIGAGYELLKYHRYGEAKYASLHRPYPMGSVTLAEERFQALVACVIRALGAGDRPVPYGKAY
ncbi:MAG: glycyl-radical enzyme activating protein [Butyrivibrio sp.]|nr:glycyl-radical enzyme activating protein [Butyrivibrio sp.]